MDQFPYIPSGRSPKRELQGPRPTPLRIHKDSRKINKPPLAPPQLQQQQKQHHQPPRQPIIIYTVSPKILSILFTVTEQYHPRRVMPRTSDVVSDMEGIELMNHGVERGNMMFQGILSPGPASLSPIPANFFSPPSSDPNMFSNLLQDFSPALLSSRNFMEPGANFFLPSPSNFVSPQTPSIDLFNYFLD
ncbi:unnamed protein product [Vicia faba]|uniref:Uncharacterized protein n=1 Tax=Vicia faba TaxID=3906 RepID=A0AAV0ZKH1_VICFA|nr:unnamed protein product [Vicia faba]